MDWFWKAIFLLIFCVPVIVLFAYATWDTIRRPDVRAWVKALWLVAFCILPIVGPLVYLVIRPPGTTAQQRALAEGTTTEADELMKLADLHDRGKITDEEYRDMKSRNLNVPSQVVPGSVREQRGGQLL